MNDHTTLPLYLLGFVVAFIVGRALNSPYKRYRIKKKIACFFGRHTPGMVRPAVGGRNIQRCDYCDKVVREYTVTKDEIRRVS